MKWKIGDKFLNLTYLRDDNHNYMVTTWEVHSWYVGPENGLPLYRLYCEYLEEWQVLYETEIERQISKNIMEEQSQGRFRSFGAEWISL